MSDPLSSDLASLKIDRSSQPQRRWPKWVAGLLGIGVLVFGYRLGAPTVEATLFKPELALTEIGLVAAGQPSVELTSSGYVVAQKVSQVGARLPGRVARVHVTEGSQVQAGDLLLELDSADREAGLRTARARVEAARARVETARAQLAEARLHANRQQRLVEDGAAARASAEDAAAKVSSLEQAVRAAEAEVKVALADVDVLRTDLDYMEVRAPIAGTVMKRPPEIGEMLGTPLGDIGTGAPVLELADFDSLVVETDVPEARLHLVKLGSPCEIVLDAYPDRRHRGEAYEISPRVDRGKATVKVKVRFVDEAPGVLPDMSARVSFLGEALDPEQLKEPPKRMVPASAVVERQGAKLVFSVEDGLARSRHVVVGEPLGEGFELLEGPSPGTRVVRDPPDTLQDGQAIKEKSW